MTRKLEIAKLVLGGGKVRRPESWYFFRHYDPIGHRRWFEFRRPRLSVGWKVGAWFPDRLFTWNNNWGRFGWRWVKR